MKVLVTIRSNEEGVPPHKVYGEAPSEDCALAVICECHYDHEFGNWYETGAYNITHRPTGWRVSKQTWATEAEALAVLENCNPTFPAWPLAGPDNEVATMACQSFFRAAVAA